MPIYMGSTKVENLHIGGTKVGEGWIWDGTQWVQVYSSASFPVGMTKAAPEFDPKSSSFQLVPGWTPDSGSTVTGDGLLIPGDKVNAQVAAEIQWRSTTSGGSRLRAELRIGATVVASGDMLSYTSSGTVTLTLSAVRDVTAGEIVRLYVNDQYANYVRVQPGTRVTVT